MSSSHPERPAPYAPPQLVRYGSILELTRASFSFNGAIDSGCMGSPLCNFFFKSI